MKKILLIMLFLFTMINITVAQKNNKHLNRYIKCIDSDKTLLYHCVADSIIKNKNIFSVRGLYKKDTLVKIELFHTKNNELNIETYYFKDNKLVYVVLNEIYFRFEIKILENNTTLLLNGKKTTYKPYEIIDLLKLLNIDNETYKDYLNK